MVVIADSMGFGVWIGSMEFVGISLCYLEGMECLTLTASGLIDASHKSL